MSTQTDSMKRRENYRPTDSKGTMSTDQVKKTHRQQGDNAYTAVKEEPTNRRGFNVYRSGKNPPTDGGGDQCLKIS